MMTASSGQFMPHANRRGRPFEQGDERNSLCSDETHLGELFALLQKKLSSSNELARGDESIRLDLTTYTAQSISGHFVDPFDGKHYELCLKPANEDGSTF